MESNLVTITPEQNIVGTVTHDLKREFSSLMKSDQLFIEVDLKNVTMIDSLGIGVLVATRNSLKEANGEFSIVNLSNDLTQLFANMKIIEFLNIR